MMQLETWEQTSLALGQEVDTLKLRLFAILNKLTLTDRRKQAAEIYQALLDCGFTDHEINLFINGNLRLGD